MVGYRHFVLKTKFFDAKVLNDLCSCSQLIACFHNLYKGETSRMGMDGVARICKEDHAFFCHQSGPVWTPEIGQIINIFQIVNQYRFEVLGFHFVS